MATCVLTESTKSFIAVRSFFDPSYWDMSVAFLPLVLILNVFLIVSVSADKPFIDSVIAFSFALAFLRFESCL